MASEVRLVVVDGPADAADRALRRVAHLERRWTRFDPDSELSWLNRAGGLPVDVSAETVVLVTAMVEAWRLTDHRYDPSTLPSLLAAGYDRSVVDGRPAAPLPPDVRRGADLDAVRIDPVAGTVQLPPRAALDPGGIGKGLAADLVASELVAGGAAGALVSIGGDLALSGRPPDGDHWTIDVEQPGEPGRRLLALHVDHGGVATSSTVSRRWTSGDRSHHHVIDPATGRPAATDLVSASVVAATAWQAEALATAALLVGSEAAPALLDDHGAAGVLVDVAGAVATTGDLAGALPVEAR
jgi:thiamine biosynthesis lipoprotein